MAASTDSEEITGINITPLVDIVLVLLIIFMVSTSFVLRQSIEVDVPRLQRGPAEVAEPPVLITMDRTGALFIDGAPSSSADATPRLHAMWQRNHQQRAVITADKSLGYGEVVKLIDLVRGAGITHFSVAK